MTVYIGTSGWQYRDWRGAFYPRKLAQKHWLPYYAERFQTVEVNNTFYRLPSTQVFGSWREQTPPDFVFAPKMSRYLSHLKRLRDPEEPVERFFEAAAGLGDKLGPVLLQLPPNMGIDLDRLDRALRAFPGTARVAVEFREDSWFVTAVRDLLARHGAALCLADRGEEMVTPEWRTCDWGYVRLHWGNGRPESSYSDGGLASWARRIERVWKASDDVFVFFNNDPHGAAVNDARRLAGFLEPRAKPTRVPPAGDVNVSAA